MYLKRYRNQHVREALRAAKEELGPAALVLSTARVPVQGWRGWLGAREMELTAAAEREPAPEPRHERAAGPNDEVVARLMAGGLDAGLADEIAAGLSANRRRGASLHNLRSALATRLSALAANDEDYAPAEVFIGPPGVGKTTTIAKIATQERARRGKRLELIAADGFRIGAVEQLRMYADIIGAQFQVARTPEELDRVLSTPRRHPVLVDTAGQSIDDGGRRELMDVLAGRRNVRTHLVIAADTPAATARRVFDAYDPARPARLVLTKLDETGSLSPLVGLLRERRIPISYLGTGQRVPEDLNRATAQLLAASVLGEPTNAVLHA